MMSELDSIRARVAAQYPEAAEPAASFRLTAEAAAADWAIGGGLAGDSCRNPRES